MSAAVVTSFKDAAAPSAARAERSTAVSCNEDTSAKHSRQSWPALEQRTRQLALLQDSYWDEFLRITAILHHFGCLKAGELSSEGRLVATLRHDNELLVADDALRDMTANSFSRQIIMPGSLLAITVSRPRK